MPMPCRLSLGLLACALLVGPAPAVEPDPYLPDDTESLVTINLRQILDSPLVKKHGLPKAKEALEGSEDAQKYLKMLGLDPFKDLDSVTIAGGGAKEADDKGVIIIHGTFNVEKLQATVDELLKEHGDILKAHTADAGGTKVKLYEVIIPDQEPMFVHFANKTTIVAAPAKAYVLDAVEKGAGRKKAALKNAAFAAVLAKLDGKQSVGIAALGSALAKGLAAVPDAKEVAQKVETLVGGVTVGGGVATEVTIETKDADGARAVARSITDGLDQAKLLLGFIAMQQKELAPLVDVLNAVKPDVKDRTVVLRAEIKADVLNKAIGGAGDN